MSRLETEKRLAKVESEPVMDRSSTSWRRVSLLYAPPLLLATITIVVLAALIALVNGTLGWMAHRTGSIQWTLISHVLLDFAGLGALVYFR